MRIKIWLIILSIAVVGLSWKVYRLSAHQSVLGAFVNDFTTQAMVFEQYRTAGLQTTNASMTAACMKVIAEFQLPDWSAGSVGRPGSAGTKYFDTAPQSTQYYVTRLKQMAERERAAAIDDLVRFLRSKTSRDLGDDPQNWIREYAGKK